MADLLSGCICWTALSTWVASFGVVKGGLPRVCVSGSGRARVASWASMFPEFLGFAASVRATVGPEVVSAALNTVAVAASPTMGSRTRSLQWCWPGQMLDELSLLGSNRADSQPIRVSG
eukprot:scaffold2788_cov376-Prasinococcus_capsulatus_cf.AAC.4